MKVHFNQLFRSKNGFVSPKVTLKINDRTRGAGEKMQEKEFFAGINLEYCIGKYFEVEDTGGILCVKGVYDSSYIERSAS